MDRLFKGEVVGVGDGCVNVKPGEIIIYDRMQPAPFKIGDEVLEMLDESQIIGVYMDE